jgi:drug/metabolite transporter (DMT)-like permease
LDVTAARAGARPLGSAYVALAALMWSLAGILQRQLHMSLASQLAGRAIFAFLALLVFIAVAERGQLIRAFRAIGRPGLAIAALMAISSGAFITALNDTTVANVLIIQALVPLVSALLGRLAGEPVHARTWAAMGVAAAGCAVMAGAPTRPGLAGLIFSLITTLTFSATIVITRRKAEVSMAPATCLSQILVFAAFAPFAHAGSLSGANLGYLALLGIAQMGLGLFFLSLGARLISAANVALISQLENVLGPLWVWLAGIEHPSAPTIAGGIIVIAASSYRSPGARIRPGDFGGSPNPTWHLVSAMITRPSRWPLRSVSMACLAGRMGWPLRNGIAATAGAGPAGRAPVHRDPPPARDQDELAAGWYPDLELRSGSVRWLAPIARGDRIGCRFLCPWAVSRHWALRGSAHLLPRACT